LGKYDDHDPTSIAQGFARRDAEFAGLPTYEHERRGRRYAVLDPAARLQTSRILTELDRVVVYRDLESGELWVRPATEFFDGRFRVIAESKEQS
jgi:hypothetical protein